MESPTPQAYSPSPSIGPAAFASASRYRVPSLRGALVARPQLLARLDDAYDRGHLVSIVAGAGFGKSTLVLQWVAGLPATTRIGWIAIDRLDVSPVRRFRGLLESLDALYPEHPPCDLARLCKAITIDETQAERAADEVCGMLDERGPDRLVWIWEDMQSVQQTATWKWVDHFVDRLPAHVCVVMTSRERLPMPMARRRVRGLVTEISQDDLCFGDDETRRFLEVSALSALAVHADELRARTGGWAAGLRLVTARRTAVLRSAERGIGERSRATRAGEAAGAPMALDPVAQGEVFEYLAQEVLADLPERLHAFLSACAVLDEIEPAVAATVAGLADAAEARACIDELLRRNLFLSVVDPDGETGPVVRLHDLLRDHLIARMRALDPAALDTAHRRAAEAENDPVRRAQHLVMARRLDLAVACLAPHAELLIKSGRGDALTRLFEAPAQPGPPAGAELDWIVGWLNWFRLDFTAARHAFDRAAEAFAADGRTDLAARGLLLAARLASYTGDIPAARRCVAAVDADRLDPPTHCEWLLEQSWLHVALGRPEVSSAHLQELAARVVALRSPEVCMRIADRLRAPYFAGLPAFAGAFERIHATIEALRASLDTQTIAHGEVMGAWSALWSGQPQLAESRLAPVVDDIERWNGYRSLRVDAGVLFALLVTIGGDHLRAIDALRQLLDRNPSSDPGVAAVWDPTYHWLSGRVAWYAGDLPALQRAYARLLALRRGPEWGFMARARQHLEGLQHYLRGDFDLAARDLGAIASAPEWFSVLMIGGDPRVEHADALLLAGRPDEAWQRAREPLREALTSGVVGALVLAPQAQLARLRALLPANDPDRLALDALLSLCEGIGAGPEAPLASGAAAASGPPAGAGSPGATDGPASSGTGFGALSGREREVLEMIVRGASNKRIAIDLDLSPHTVKRHVANILAKVGAESRAELIARYLGGRSGD